VSPPAPAQSARTGFLAPRTNILLKAQGLPEAYPLIIQDLGVFLHLDAIGTQRQRRTGKDPRTGAGLQWLRCVTRENTLTDR
jgi:hypothetical protein